MRGAKTTWVVAGAMLLFAMLIRVAQLGSGVGSETVVTVLTDAVTAAAILLLAVGATRAQSVVDRRPLGVLAMTVFAGWPLTAAVIEPSLPQMNQATYDRGLDAYRAAEAALTAFWMANILVPLAASLICALVILRSPTVSRNERWVPLAMWGFSVLVGAAWLTFFAVPLWWLNAVGPLALVGLFSMIAGWRDHRRVGRLDAARDDDRAGAI